MTERSPISSDRKLDDYPRQQVGVKSDLSLDAELRHLEAPREQSPIVVSSCRLPDSRGIHCTAEIARLLGRMQREIIEGAGVAIYVTSSASASEGVSIVAQAMIGAAARLPWCKALLLDANPVSASRNTALSGTLPDLVDGFAARGMLEVAAMETEYGTFHAANLSRQISACGILILPMLQRLLGFAYNIIVVDCPPILEQPYLPLISTQPL